MRRIVLGLFALIGIVTVLAFIGVGAAVWRIAGSQPALPETIVLSAELGRGLTEGAGQDSLSDLVFGSKETLRDVLDALERGGNDARVKGLYARLGADTLGLATCQELRDAIRDFRAKGKFAIAFADTFGEFGPATRPYYLATAFDEIWLQPLGSLGLVGLHSESTFFRGALDRLGILPSFAHREEYKSAMNSLTETAMTPPQREEIEDLLRSSSGQIVRGIASARKLSEAEVTALIDRGPYVANEAKAARLVDRIGYRDEAVTTAQKRAGSGAELVSLSRYLAGSGGYYIAAPADKIVAQPATLTGSIGVLAGKLVVSELLHKLGVTGDSAQRGANAAMFSVFEDFSPAGRQRLDTFLDEVYGGFKQHVADGRHLSADQVEAAAKGRVWSGEEAKEKGLVDELGGYDVALRLAKEAAKIPADKPFTLTVFPREKGTVERVYNRLFKPDRDAASPAAAQGVAAGFAKLLAGIEMLVSDPGVLRM